MRLESELKFLLKTNEQKVTTNIGQRKFFLFISLKKENIQ